MPTFKVPLNRMILALALVACLRLLASSCHTRDTWEGRTFKVDYAWDSQVRLIRVIDTASDKDVNDPVVRAKIAKAADQELPRWIALSKLKVAKGTFHIRFPRGQDTEILEAAHGMEGIGPDFVKDPQVTELMSSAHEGRLDVLPDLIARGENVNAVDQLGNTALMASVSSGKVEVLRFLINHGANIDARNADGESALTLSVFSRQPNMVNELLSRDAKLDCSNPTDRATFEAAKRSGLKLVSRLRRATVNCNHSSDE